MKPQATYTRFSIGQRLEHALMIISFTLLALTGLPQKYAGDRWAETLIAWIGGVEMVRRIHHTAAVMLILESVFHIVAVGYRVYVRGARVTSMLPAWRDVQDFFATVAHNLGLRRESPLFDRYSFDEKLEYWSLIWGTLIMILTGFMLWNPIAVTQWLPGDLIPAAKAAHGGEALLAVLAIITWHVYHVHLRHFNRSVFTGRLTREEMLEDHPLELARIEGGLEQPLPPPLLHRRRRLYIPVASFMSAVLLLGVYWFVTLEVTAITTIPPEPTQVVFQRVIPEVTSTPEQIVSIPVPHRLNGHEHCRRCHAAGTIRPFPADHAGYRNDSLCLDCHAPGPTAAQVTLSGEGLPSFSTDIEPALQANCVVCHGVAGGLNLSSYIWIMAGGDAGPAVMPGRPDQSLIIQVLDKGHFADLPARTKADLRQWILAGAPDN